MVFLNLKEANSVEFVGVTLFQIDTVPGFSSYTRAIPFFAHYTPHVTVIIPKGFTISSV